MDHPPETSRRTNLHGCVSHATHTVSISRISIKTCLPLFSQLYKQTSHADTQTLLFFHFQAAAAFLIWSSIGSNSSTRRTRWCLRNLTSWWRECWSRKFKHWCTVKACLVMMGTQRSSCAKYKWQSSHITADVHIETLCLFVLTLSCNQSSLQSASICHMALWQPAATAGCRHDWVCFSRRSRQLELEDKQSMLESELRKYMELDGVYFGVHT